MGEYIRSNGQQDRQRPKKRQMAIRNSGRIAVRSG
jgi:hypothetical protein